MSSLTPFPPEQQPHHHIISFPPRATGTIEPEVELVDGLPVTSSLQVAAFFRKQHKHVLRDIENILETVRESTGPNFGLSEYKDPTGRTLPMYFMDKDAFTLLVMGYTGEDAMRFKLAYIRRFNEMEAQLRVILPNFSDPVLAARAWADAQEQKLLAEKKALALEAQAAEDRPLVGFAKAVQASEDTILIRQLAGFLKQNGIDIGQNRLFEWLRNNGYLCRERGESWNRPTQKSMNLGLFETKQSIGINPDGTTRIFLTTKVTGKGQVFFLRKFGAVANNKNTPNDPAAAPEEAPAS